MKKQEAAVSTHQETNRYERFVSRLTRDTTALILAGGRGSRLKEMTDWRAKPAVPFGGKFRIIDFPLSNCFNSGIRRVGVLTQYKSHSLTLHIQKAWSSTTTRDFSPFVELLPAQQRIDEESWYTGTANAIYQNLDIIRRVKPKYVLILAGDHIYKMDYGEMLAFHVDNNADITVGCLEVPKNEAKEFGVIGIDESNRIVSFVEKPDNPAPMPGKPDNSLASMGIYVFNAEFLFEQLITDQDKFDSDHDFGKNIIPASIESHDVYGYPFRDAQKEDRRYWRDVGTIDAYWKANMELIGIDPELDLYDSHWPVWTYQEQLPPAKFIFDDDDRRGMAVDSMISGGCIVSGATVRHSLLFSNVKVNSYAQLEDAVILPNVEIGRGTRIRKAVIDKECIIPEGMVIGEDPKEDEKRFRISSGGVVLVTPEMLDQFVHITR